MKKPSNVSSKITIHCKICFNPNLLQSWKSFDFGPQKVVSKKTAQAPDYTSDEQEKSTTINKWFSQKPSFDFFAQLTPKVISELAVHSKKIEEVKSWLETVFVNNPSVCNGN